MFVPLKLHPDGTRYNLRLDLIEGFGEGKDEKGRNYTAVYTVTGGEPYYIMGTMKSFEKMLKFYAGELDENDDMSPFVFFPNPEQDNTPEGADVE